MCVWIPHDASAAHVFSPVDAGGVHQVRDAAAGFLDGLEAPLHFLFFRDVTAEGQVVSWNMEQVKVKRR